jgi:hypothetical protein
MLPRAQHRFLHKVLRALPIASGQAQRVCEQRIAVLGVQRPQQLCVFLPHLPRALPLLLTRNTVANGSP